MITITARVQKNLHRSLAATPSPQRIRIDIRSNKDILEARQQAAGLSRRQGFSSTYTTLAATVVSELGRHLLLAGRHGVIVIEPSHDLARIGWYSEPRIGLRIIAAHDAISGLTPSGAHADLPPMRGPVQLSLLGIRAAADEFFVQTHPCGASLVSVVFWARGLLPPLPAPALPAAGQKHVRTDPLPLPAGSMSW